VHEVNPPDAAPTALCLKGDLNMKTHKWLTPKAWRGGLMGIVLAASGPAMAASYNIILKTSTGTALTCATGGFTFNKTDAGTFPSTGASVTLSGCLTSFVPIAANGTYTGTPSVVVENVTLIKPGTGGQNEPLNQGPNVEGLDLPGTLQFTTLPTSVGNCQGNGPNPSAKTYTITFDYTGGQDPANRTFTLECTAGPGNYTYTGRYHVYNTANPVPEPESLALVIVGLSAVVLSGHLRRRRK
jgi:hypothetical protein